MATALHHDHGLAAADTADAAQSAVNWASIFAGAVVAIATTLILIAVGSGLGFAAASPWPGSGPSATSFAVGVGIWLIVTQWLSSAGFTCTLVTDVLLTGMMIVCLRSSRTGIKR